jgi:hypothetical protein
MELVIKLFSKDARPQIPLSWVALLRLMLGAMFLTTWASNFSKGFYTPDGLVVFFSQVFPQSENPLAWYAGFINTVIRRRACLHRSTVG